MACNIGYEHLDKYTCGLIYRDRDNPLDRLIPYIHGKMNLAMREKNKNTFILKKTKIIQAVEGCTVAAALGIECYFFKKCLGSQFTDIQVI